MFYSARRCSIPNLMDSHQLSGLVLIRDSNLLGHLHMLDIALIFVFCRRRQCIELQ